MSRPKVETVNLYALSGSRDEPEVHGLALAKALQDRVSEVFADLYEAQYPEDAELLAFDPGYSPEDHELFEIAPFAPPPKIAAVLDGSLVPPRITSDEVEAGVRALMAVDPKSKVALFQHVNRGMVLRRDALRFFLSKSLFHEQKESGFVLGDRVDARLVGDALRFPKALVASWLFDLSEAVTAATDEDIDVFLGHRTFASVNPALFKGAADTWCRRKLHAIEQSGILESVRVSAFAKAASKYGVTLELSGSGAERKIVLPTVRKELKAVLRLLDNDYLDSTLTADRFQVSSKRRLER